MRALSLLLLLALAAPSLAQEPGMLDDPGMVERLRAREQELLDRVRAMDPARYADLVRLKQVDPRAYMATLFRLARLTDKGPAGTAPSPELQAQIRALEALRAAHPEGFDGLSKAEQKDLRSQVLTIAGRIFELRQAERRRRIEELETALADLAADVARRDRDRQALLEAFADQFFVGRVDL